MNEKVNIIIGQRWMSEAEPELGLGMVSKVYEGKIEIRFILCQLTRQYTIFRAPIKRVRFKPGDSLTTKSGESFIVEGINEINGLLYYSYQNKQLCETELADTIPVNKPADRMEAFDFDPPGTFHLRYQTLCLRENMHKSIVKGFCGARIDVIPHQLYIADTVAARHLPRVMLSDQVGLGKTIEALLIINKLIITNRVKSVLIIVPEHLVLQWFGELYHRFNLIFSVIDEQYCIGEQEKDPDFNPFNERQFCICCYSVFTTFPGLRELSLENPWDLMVIDEVHNLRQASEEYGFFKDLAGKIPRLLLLTAIPEYPNLEDFFARLHLIDPVFYDKYERFFWEIDHYKWVSGLAEILRNNRPLQSDHIGFLREKMSADYPEKDIFPGDGKLDKETRRKILDYLIDQHGMGRHLFRNTRKTISGFPRRVVHLAALSPGQDKSEAERLFKEFEFDVKERERPPDYFFDKDPRVSWLLSLLKKGGKILLICTSKRKVLALAGALKINGFKDFLCFHEEIEFLERDHQVALFYQAEGPQLLLSSEIGSEGRNFQFCTNLVFFDVPFNPSLIEQRIGRLDRIGQKETINIFIPFIIDSPQAFIVNWFYTGLNIFKEFYDGHNQTFSAYSSFIKNMALKGNYDPAELDHITSKTKKEYTKIKKKNEKGRDILVELNSFDKTRAKEIIGNIHREDSNNSFESSIMDLLEFYGFHRERIDNRTYQLTTGAVKSRIFSQLVPDGLIITFDRNIATKRTDYAFITLDHELTTRSVDHLLGLGIGNCTYATWVDTEKQDLLFEIIYLLECIAPPEYNLGRFLPISPIRIVVNQKLEDLTDTISYEKINEEFSGYTPRDFTDLRPLIQKFGKEMFTKSITFAEKRAGILKKRALDEVEKIIGSELKRLEILKKVNAHIKEQEVVHAAGELESIKGYIHAARLRMDSIRIIQQVKP